DEDTRMQYEEKTKKDKKRIESIYGKHINGLGTRIVRKRREIYLFTSEDIDNEDIISMFENTPTYSRSRTSLKKIQEKTVLEEKTSIQNYIGDNGEIIF
ncbi:hypothetical protein EZS27_033402, partial [termite gut metagenome]